jgi:hypothetical protein
VIAKSGPGAGSSLLLVVGTWLALRIVFFEGLWGFDDLYHVNYALHLDHIPTNHWETRLLFNGFLALSIRMFGFHQWALALPGLLGSLAFTLSTWWAGRRVLGEHAGLLAGLFAATLVGDVTLSTNPAATSLANGFAAAGTAALLVAGGRGRILSLAGVLLGCSALAHPVMMLYVGIVTAATLLAGLPRLEWRTAAVVGGTSAVTFLLGDLGAFWWLTGNPLYAESVIVGKPDIYEVFAEPLRLASGALNPRWFVWPVWNLLFSKAFGLCIAVPLIASAIAWRHLETRLRLATLTVLLYWAWVCYGSQLPFKYVPLDHDTRYWYPAALPALLLAAAAVGRMATSWGRATLCALLLVPNCLMLLAAGSWGQNVQISRDLLRFASAHPDAFFVTDGYSYDEMYILLGGRPPENVGLIGDARPFFYQPDTSMRRAGDDPTLLVLYNPLQEWRVNFGDFRAQISGLPRRDISDRTYRLIAYVLPAGMRARYPFLLRRPAAQLASSASPDEPPAPAGPLRSPVGALQPVENSPKRVGRVNPGPEQIEYVMAIRARPRSQSIQQIRKIRSVGTADGRKQANVDQKRQPQRGAPLAEYAVMLDIQIDRVSDPVELPAQRDFAQVRSRLRKMHGNHPGVENHLEPALANRQAMIGFDPVAAAVRPREQGAVVQSRAIDRLPCKHIAKAVHMLDFDRLTAVAVEIGDDLAALVDAPDALARAHVASFNHAAPHTTD